jgi:hypothetical protein
MGVYMRIGEHLRLKQINYQLKESKLSRIWQYVEDDHKSFGVVSASHKGDPKNKEHFAELRETIKKLGYGYIELQGGYKEIEGFVTELSLFIPKIDKKTLIKLGQKYDQESVIYKDGKEFSLIGTNRIHGVGTVIRSFIKSAGKSNMTMAAELTKEFFSSLVKGSHGGRKFLFQLQERKSYNHISLMGGFRAFWFNVIKDDKVLEGNDLIRHYNDELLKATKGKIHLDKKWLE